MLPLYKQVAYLKYISHSLPLFRDQGKRYSCRCIVCGDSKKDQNKARGNFFVHDNHLLYKCFNCGYSVSFDKFLKDYFPSYYEEAIFEEFSSNPKDNPLKNNVEKSISKLKRRKNAINNSVLADYQTLNKVEDDNPCKRYLIKRGLQDYLGIFYYIPSLEEFVSLLPDYNSKEKKRKYDFGEVIGIPHWNRDKTELDFIQMRLLPSHIGASSHMRYLTFKVNAGENTPKVFGLERLNPNKRIINVTEGAFDSLFVDNCIAISGLTDWRRIVHLQDHNHELRYIIDNDWVDNKQVRGVAEDIINAGYSVCLLPNNQYERWKDLNDAYLDGYSKEEIEEMIQKNTFKGLSATFKLKSGRR